MFGTGPDVTREAAASDELGFQEQERTGPPLTVGALQNALDELDRLMDLSWNTVPGMPMAAGVTLQMSLRTARHQVRTCVQVLAREVARAGGFRVLERWGLYVTRDADGQVWLAEPTSSGAPDRDGMFRLTEAGRARLTAEVPDLARDLAEVVDNWTPPR